MAQLSKKAKGKSKAAAPPHNKGGKPSKPTGGAVKEKGPKGKPKRKADQPKKVKLRDQKSIPVPASSFKRHRGHDDLDEDDKDEDDDLEGLGEDEDLESLDGAAAFLQGADPSALSRSTNETKRLHKLSKAQDMMPVKPRKKSGLPSPPSSVSSMSDFDSDDDLESLDDDEEEAERSVASGSSPYDSGADLDDDAASLASDLESMDDEESSDEEEEDLRQRRKGKRKAEVEADYELAGRARWKVKPEGENEGDSVEVGRLPIKLPSGKVQMVEGSTKISVPKKKAPPPPPSEDSDDVMDISGDEDEPSDDEALAEKMAGQKGKFGRLAIAEIATKKGWKNADRLAAAKEQIATLGADILGGGELVDIAPGLTRLSTFALATVPHPEDGTPVPLPASIRGLAFLSQLAVYKDLIPGYRIRDLTEKEEAVKVRDEVARQRDGEKALVRSYKGYLKLLEAEAKHRTPLAAISLKCLCDLLSSAAHFNFSENIMGILVGRVGKKSWDDESELVLQTFVSVFKEDVTGLHSQTLVRLIARMIKERKFQVHPNILTCFLRLRLRQELDKMRDGNKKKGKPDTSEPKGSFKSEVRKKWATKNQRKKEKELKEIRKEMAEAEAEVDKEERAQVQTETLKNLFVLYFSILKHPGRSPLLASALEGITNFAHFINIDFFRDLLAVLRTIIADQAQIEDEEEDEESRPVNAIGQGEQVRLRLLAIVTAFELLSGQGEAINMDLSLFINHLFALLRPLSLDTTIEDPPFSSTSVNANSQSRPLQIGRAPPRLNAVQEQTTSALMMRCLHATFFGRNSINPSYRTAAFAKRLMESSLLFPANTAKAAIDLVRAMVAKDAKLEGLLDTEERMFDGVYKPEADDPQLSNPFATGLWELETLAVKHADQGVREVAAKLRKGNVAA